MHSLLMHVSFKSFFSEFSYFFPSVEKYEFVMYEDLMTLFSFRFSQCTQFCEKLEMIRSTRATQTFAYYSITFFSSHVSGSPLFKC